MIDNQEIQLRAPELFDLDIILKWENDESLWHLSQTLVPFSRNDIEQFILNNNQDIYTEKQFRFMIERKVDKMVLGCIDLFDFDSLNKRAGVGILIDEKYQKQGWASQSLELLINYSKNHLQLHQLYCNILQSNTDSFRLFKRKHFSEIGVKKDWICLNGIFQDEILLQLIL